MACHGDLGRALAELVQLSSHLLGLLILHPAHLQAVPALHRDRLPSCHALCEPADVQQGWAGATWGRGRPAVLPADGLLG